MQGPSPTALQPEIPTPGESQRGRHESKGTRGLLVWQWRAAGTDVVPDPSIVYEDIQLTIMRS